jgi:hypothetical protein
VATTSSNEIALAHMLLPGFAYWGWRGPFGLHVHIGGPVDRISITFTRSYDANVNFPRVHFFGAENNEILRSAVVGHVDISGYRKPIWERWPVASLLRYTRFWRRLRGREGAFTSFLSGHSLRARGEIKPTLNIVLKKEVTLSRILLENMMMTDREITRHVRVSGLLGEKIVFSQENFSEEALVAEMREVHGALGIAVPDLALESERAAHCRAVHTELCAALEAGRLTWTPRRLMQFLPLFEGAPEMDAHRLSILAEIICSLLGQELTFPTPVLKDFAPLLSSVSRLEAVMAEVNRRLAERRPMKTQVIMSKHRTQPPLLLLRKNWFIQALSEAFPALEACGVQSMLAYGGLLGAVREKGFLRHDDDIDLIYFDGAQSFDDMVMRRDLLRDKLGQMGFRCGKGKLINFHIKSPNGQCWLDLFPSYQKGDSLYVMVNRQRYVAMPMSIFFPMSKISLYGEEFPAPADPEAFLNARYGPGWRTPDAYYAWSWPLSRD